MNELCNWLIENGKLFYWLAFSIAIPSTILYILEIVTIVRNNKFSSSSFYKLFCMRGIADIIGMLCSSYGNRLPVLFGQQLLPIYRALPTWTFVLFYYFTATIAFQVTNIVTVLILVNRFTAIAFPMRHKKIWIKMNWIMAFLLLALPLSTCYPILRMNAIIDFFDSDGNQTF
ncbi:hypothetical protein GPALN_010293, partial [Globodera pallida]